MASEQVRLARRETIENLLDHAKHGGLGHTRETGQGKRDPMCLQQHIHRRILHQPESAVSQEAANRPSEDRKLIEAIELTTAEQSALASFHNAETCYLQRIGRTDSRGAAKLRDTPEILERILSGEKVKVRGTEIDVDADFDAMLKEEFERAGKRAKEGFGLGPTLDELANQHPAYFARNMLGQIFEESALTATELRLRHERERAIYEQRRLNEQMQREQLFQVERDPISQTVYVTGPGGFREEWTEAQLRDHGGRREFRVPVQNAMPATFTQTTTGSSSIPTEALGFQHQTYSFGITI